MKKFVFLLLVTAVTAVPMSAASAKTPRPDIYDNPDHYRVTNECRGGGTTTGEAWSTAKAERIDRIRVTPCPQGWILAGWVGKDNKEVRLSLAPGVGIDWKKKQLNRYLRYYTTPVHAGAATFLTAGPQEVTCISAYHPTLVWLVITKDGVSNYPTCPAS